ncbi:zinc finger protein 845 [Elysia marginata]|uniref:Zinc finger protein 845 n=1 Tax=Elysia marginata TaxID=1093978 RepID=A0AAV4EBY6_9GAST|nr:zinc finger protein 845 [Elysia marginata]
MVYPRSSTTQDKGELSGTQHFTEQRMSSDCHPMAMEDPVLPLGSSPQGNEDADCDLAESENEKEGKSISPISLKTFDHMAIPAGDDVSHSKLNGPRGITKPEESLPVPPITNSMKKQSASRLRKKPNAKLSDVRGVKTKEELKKSRAKLMMLGVDGTQKRKCLVLSKSQLDIYLKSNQKNNGVADKLKAEASGGSAQPENAVGLDESEINQQDMSEDSVNKNPPQEKPVTCQCCAKSFPSKKEYYRHKKFQPEKYVCLKCNTAFPFKAYLLVHWKYHNDTEPRSSYSCDQCSFQCSNLSSLKKHMVIHTKEPCFQCCRCQKTFVTHDRLVKHMTSGSHRRPNGLIKCSCCNELFPTRGALARHRAITVQWPCGICGQVFPNNTSRNIHYLAEHKDTVLKCHVCGRMYATQEELNKHLIYHRQKHTQCSICGVMVLKIEDHMKKVHTPMDEIPESELFMCDQCPKRFKTFDALRWHMARHVEKRQKCHLCAKDFRTQDRLSRHLINVHSDLRRHQCEICGMRCKHKNNLKVHMRTHSDIKMFPCNFCDLAFKSKGSLNRHIRSKHSIAVAHGSSSLASKSLSGSVSAGGSADPGADSVMSSSTEGQAQATFLHQPASLDGATQEASDGLPWPAHLTWQ